MGEVDAWGDMETETALAGAAGDEEVVGMLIAVEGILGECWWMSKERGWAESR